MPFIVKSKWGRLHHIKEALKLKWANERRSNGKVTSKPSKHRFVVSDVLLTFNKNRDLTECYVREITPEQSAELQSLYAEVEKAHAVYFELSKRHSDLIKRCFETGRGMQVDELLKGLREANNDTATVQQSL